MALAENLPPRQHLSPWHNRLCRLLFGKADARYSWRNLRYCRYKSASVMPARIAVGDGEYRE